ncbi:lysine 6-monooxygenase, partial [Enterobacteriaceae bacterium ML5]
MPAKDLIGIGIGPFNLSLAAMAKDTEKLNTAFFDANPEFSWHPGMLLPTATMQTYVLQDLVTTVAPRSEFSFINYLVEQKKIYRFLATEQLIISRDEFSDYLRWACDRIPDLHFSAPVESIDFDDKRQEFVVQSEKG